MRTRFPEVFIPSFIRFPVAGKVGGWVEGVTPDTESVTDLEIEEAEDVSKDPSIGPATPMQPPAKALGISQTRAWVLPWFLCHELNGIAYPNFFSSETRTGNTLYQELSFQDSEVIGDVDEGADITGRNLNPRISSTLLSTKTS